MPETKCSTHGTLCNAMRTMLAKRPRISGFHVVQFVDKKRGAFMDGIRYKRTVSHRGALVNFCPWCGGDFRDAYRRARKTPEV